MLIMYQSSLSESKQTKILAKRRLMLDIQAISRLNYSLLLVAETPSILNFYSYLYPIRPILSD